jgi:uncharacterized protein YqjF (DUF2071 family)
MTSTEMPRADLRLDPPVHVERPTMVQRWEDLSFVHWAFDPDDVRRRLPAGLELDTFAGAAWVGMIPFRLRIRRPGVPYIPWVSSFPETNLRTYVIGPDGQPGIWFLSLEAARLGAVAIARADYRLPYVWARTRMEKRGSLVRYWGRRRWPASPADARYDVTLDVGAPIGDARGLDLFLSSRWHLYSPGRMRLPATGIDLVRTTVEHARWPLRAARVVHLEETLLAAAGLPAPREEPVALFSPGVTTRFERRRRL